MKCRYWPFSAASADSSLSRIGAIGAVAVAIDDAHAAAPDLGDVAFLEEHEAPGHRQQRRDVGGDEVLVDAEARCTTGQPTRATMMRSGSVWLMTASA